MQGAPTRRMLFRYLSEEHALLAIQGRELKVGRLGELNDPADCQPILFGAPLPTNDVSAATAFEKNYFASIFEDVGILCFSASIRDPVIWSHYAAGHRGIAIGYEFGIPNPRLSDVVYQDERAVLEYSKLEELRRAPESTNLFLDQVIAHGFTRKAQSWCYEREARLFLSLYACTPRGAHYFIHMPPDCVVLGLKSRFSEADIIRMAVPGTLIDRVTRAQLDRAKYRLNVAFKDPSLAGIP